MPLPARRPSKRASFFPGAPEVTVWVMSSPFVHVTVAPLGTLSGEGLNEKMRISTAPSAASALVPSGRSGASGTPRPHAASVATVQVFQPAIGFPPFHPLLRADGDSRMSAGGQDGRRVRKRRRDLSLIHI